MNINEIIPTYLSNVTQLRASKTEYVIEYKTYIIIIIMKTVTVHGFYGELWCNESIW